MTITTTTLTRAAALAAVAGGVLFGAVQIGHPLLTVPFTTTTEYTVRETAKILMAVFSLVGITGIYLRQVRQTGVLGLIGYLLLGVGYLTILSTQVIAVFVVPDLAARQPSYVSDALAVAHSGHPVGDVSRFHDLNNIAITYIAGGVLLGIALFRAKVLARWAAALMVVGALATIATFQLPELVQRLFAIPVAVALIGLGYSLWRDQRSTRDVTRGKSGQLSPRPGRSPVTTQAATRSRRPARFHRPAPAGRPSGWVPFALIALVLLPAVFGSLRLVELSGGPQLMTADPRFTASPLPLVVHIVSAVSYAVLGAFQFSAGLRRRRPGWHRTAGRVLVVLGLAVVLSALWMTLFYPRQPGTGVLAYLFRLAFASGMAASIILGLTAIRRRDIARHQAWMTRAYALALGAGTQVFTKGIGPALFGTSALTLDLSLGAAWAINLAVAEYVIRRPAKVGPR